MVTEYASSRGRGPCPQLCRPHRPAVIHRDQPEWACPEISLERAVSACRMTRGRGMPAMWQLSCTMTVAHADALLAQLQ
jgi:hypothetical protein